jgi:hypothetical protein
MCKATAKLNEIMGSENATNLVNMIDRVKGRAIERSSQQTVQVTFNEKGFVRHINGSDNVNGVKPKMYASE